ncbi:MAG TPA: hypothetical protein VFN05_09740 [Actinomycetes bacterium]|nr:hypothetical protein [Actinomycetes bacterium]
MLHLRIITPADLTATVLQELAHDLGVTHITVDRVPLRSLLVTLSHVMSSGRR